MNGVTRCVLLAAVLIAAGCGGTYGTIGTPPPPGPGPSGTGSWFAYCPHSHSMMDDPIVFPRQVGASHLHDFFGNTTTNANSTLASMTSGDTTCSRGSDTAGYWVPAVMRAGVRLDLHQAIALYTKSTTLSENTRYTVPPADLRVVLGRATATRPEDNPGIGTRMYWACGDGNPLREPPAACPGGIISLTLEFPECWNGALDSADHRSHVAYATGATCPSTHPTAIPMLTLFFEYPIGTQVGTLTLASGSIYSVHGDFWNTWNQARLQQLVNECVNASMDCGYTDSHSSGSAGRVPIRRPLGGSGANRRY